MADEEKKEAAPPAEGAAPAKPSGIKALIPKLILPVAVLAGMGVGAGVMKVMHKDPPPVAAEAAGEEKAAEGGHADEKKAEPGDEHAAAPGDEHAEAPKAEAKAEQGHGEEKAAAKEGEHGAEGGEADKAAAAGAGLLVKFDPLVVNISEKNSIHYLKLQLEVQVDQEGTIQEIDQNKAQIRDRLVFIFSDSSLREVLSTGGKALLKEDILVALNKILTKGKVTNVYFTDFTVQ